MRRHKPPHVPKQEIAMEKKIPIKKKKYKREHTFLIKFSTNEFKILNEKCAVSSKNKSEFIRELIMQSKVWTIKNKAIEQEKIREIARVGNNLNQIARWCNIHKSAADSVEVIQHLLAIRSELEKLKSNA